MSAPLFHGRYQRTDIHAKPLKPPAILPTIDIYAEPLTLTMVLYFLSNQPVTRLIIISNQSRNFGGSVILSSIRNNFV
jgi:hypothetical protein